VRSNHFAGLGASVRRVAWDYGSETDLSLPPVIIGSRSSAQLPGTNILAWSWVRNFNEYTSPGLVALTPATTAAATGTTLAQNLRQNLNRMVITEDLAANYDPTWAETSAMNPCKPPNYWPIYETGCLECKKRWVAYRKDELINPTILGIGQRERVVTMDANILRATTDPNTVLVIGSDEAKWATGQKRKGAIVNRTFPQFVGNVTNTMTADPPAWGSPSAGTDTQLRFVMSQRRQDVAFFNRKQTDGSMLQGYYVYDLDTQAMRYEFFNGDSTIDNIQSVTYRAEDDAYYFLEGAPLKPSLYRLPRGNVPERIASWTPSTSTEWKVFTGAKGELILATQKGTDSHFAVLEYAASGTPAVYSWQHRVTRTLTGTTGVVFGLLGDDLLLTMVGTTTTTAQKIATETIWRMPVELPVPVLGPLSNVNSIF
jgi:hypothetical protein